MTLSTDLGSIEAEAQQHQSATVDVLGPLVSAGAEVIKGAVRKELNTLEDDFDDTSKAALASVSPEATPSTGEPSGPPLALASEEAQLVNRIRTLQAGISQSQGSTQARLQLELRKRAEELSERFPGLRDEVGAELRLFESTNPEFAAIAAFDLAQKNIGRQQLAELETIRDAAYGDVGSGNGLGMDPAVHEFGTVPFAREYLDRSRLVQESRENQILLANMQGTDDISARNSARAYQQYATGRSNAIRETVNMVRSQLDVVGQALKDPTAANAAEVIQAWNTGGKDSALKQVQGMIFDLENQFAQIPVTQSHTDAYKGAKDLKSDRVAALNTLLEGISTSSPTIMQAWEAYETMQLISFEKENPVFAGQARIMLELAPILDMIDADFGAAGDIVRNDVAGFLEQGLGPVLGRTFGTTNHANLPPNASIEELEQHYSGIRSSNDTIWDNGQRGPTAEQTMVTTDSAIRSRQPYLQMAIRDAVHPKIATAQTGHQASVLASYMQSGPLTTDGNYSLLDDLAQDGWVQMGRIARQSDQPNTPVLLGDKYEELWFKNEPARLQLYNELHTKEISFELPLSQVIRVDKTNIDKGEFIVRVDTELVRQLHKTKPTVAAARQGFVFGPDINAINHAIRNAEAFAAALSRRVTLDLKANAHMEALQNNLDEPDYVGAWESGSFDRFGPITDE